MKLSEVISLLKAGYTKKEIEDLRAQETASTEMNASAIIEDTPDRRPEATPPAYAQEAEPKAPDYSQQLAVMQSQLQDLTKAIRAQNIRNADMPVRKQDSAVDILGSIINNPIRKGE